MKSTLFVGRTIVHWCIGTLVGVSGLAQGAGNPKLAGQTVLGVPCAEIAERGLDKQANLRAGMIRMGCGVEEGPGWTGEGIEQDSVLDLIDINLITGPEIFPNVTQSESMVWSHGDTIVVNYNDSRDRNAFPLNLSGISVSFDGGNTFERINPHSPLVGHGDNFGDPVVVYNEALGAWYAGDLADGCSRFGIGMWTSTDAMTWTAAPCAHNGTNDDRESMWVDNNAASPFFGRMYVSWNDFNPGRMAGKIFVVHSDDGLTWSTPVQVENETVFVRNIQLTGSPDDGGTVFIAGMDEGGAGQTRGNATNYVFRSLDGGDHWTRFGQGPSFAPPGEHLCGYFWGIPPIWRHEGGGQPGVGPGGVVHYVYAGRGINEGDEGDIYYIRSNDNGETWTAPIVLNSDAAAGGTRSQWMPSLSVSPEGIVTISWYDRRNTTDNSYEFWMIQSPDNGQSFWRDERVSDQIIPQPEQADPGIQRCYVGDYNYHTAVSNNAWITWADGRVQIDGHNQQDVFFAAVPLVQASGAIDGTVTDATTGNPIGGARVQAMGLVSHAAGSHPDGTYHIGGLPGGSYDMTVTAFGYNPGSATGVMVVDGQTTTQNFTLTLGPAHMVSGTVSDSGTALPISGATVRILNTPIPPAMTDDAGMYNFPSVPEGTYYVQASAPGYVASTRTGVVVDRDVVVDFAPDPTVAPCNPDGIDIPSECDMVAGNLVANCGFENAFASWTPSGDVSNTRVSNASAHSGILGLDTGPVDGLGFIAQNLATTPGARYNLSFWLANLPTPRPSRFQVSWGGTVIYDVSGLPVFSYRHYCWAGTAPSDSTELKFGFYDRGAVFYFDDVVVTPQ